MACTVYGNNAQTYKWEAEQETWVKCLNSLHKRKEEYTEEVGMDEENCEINISSTMKFSNHVDKSYTRMSVHGKCTQ